ncbi:MAG: STAS domain-containing protein [Gammaproteobacteria bacterium]|nr:STAS domain-containing protein [Gammaproteobacteria bacterium]
MVPRLEECADGTTVLTGDLNSSTVSALYSSSQPVFRTDSDMVIDLKTANDVDSAGVALLVEWVRRARARNCRLRFRAMSTQLEDLIRVYGVDHLLQANH